MTVRSRTVAIIGLVLPVATATGQESQSPRRAVVTAVTGGLVYFTAGRLDGLSEGAPVWIARLGERGRYRVRYLASHSAAAGGDSTTALPNVGDTVEYTPEKRTVETASASPGSQTSRAARSGPRMRGRVGLRYLSSSDRASGLTVTQPGFELLLDGPVSPTAPIGLAVDIRPRRVRTARDGRGTTTLGVTGVYQAAMRLQSVRGPVRVVAGRQYAPTLAGVGLFDGVLIDFARPRWSVGAAAGLIPEPGTLAISSETRQFGAYLQARSPRGARARWTITAGGMGSYQAGEINREFCFVQGTLSAKGLSAIVLQELDVNRGWKIAAGEPRVSPTSTYLSLHLTPGRWLTLTGGLDSRRNVRLYRDLATPEAEFDDRFRRGAWGGATMMLGRHLRLGGDIRTRWVDGVDSLTTSAVSSHLSVEQLTAAGLGVRFRGTRYRTPGRGTGHLLSASVRLAPRGVVDLELTGGRRGEATSPDTDRTWAGIEMVVFAKRSWLMTASYSREWGRGPISTTELLFAGASYRF